jgi:holliday junction DNA helicase RuvA
MLTRISGRLLWVDGGRAGIDVEALGMSFEVMLPGYLSAELSGSVGSAIALYTLLQLDPVGQSSSLSPRLIGFAEARDKEFFALFTTVKGVGGKRALRAMAEPPGVLAGYIASRDHAALQRLPEIGKRLAETIVAELHGKVDGFIALDIHVAEGGSAVRSGGPVDEAIEALVRLGETRGEAEQKVRRASQQDSTLESAASLLSAALSHGM